MGFFITLLVDGICAGAHYALLGMAFALIFNTQRMFDISFGGVYTWAGFAMWFLMKQLGIGYTLSIFIVLVGSFVLSLAIQKTYMRSLRKRSETSLSVLLGSFAVLLAMQAVVSIFWGGDIRLARVHDPKVFNFAGIFINDIKLLTVFLSVASFAFFQLVFLKSKLGVKARAIASNRMLAETLGLESERVIMMVTSIGTIVAVFGSILTAIDTGAFPGSGFQSVLIAFMAVILGGIGSFKGAALGGLVIGIVRTLSVSILPTLWQELLLFLILFLLISFKPTGIFGIKDWKSEL